MDNTNATAPANTDVQDNASATNVVATAETAAVNATAQNNSAPATAETGNSLTGGQSVSTEQKAGGAESGSLVGSQDGQNAAQQAAQNEEPKAQEPVDYVGSYSPPEGISFNKERYAEVAKLYEELGLTKEQAQKLTDAHIDEVRRVAKEKAENSRKLVESCRASITGRANFAEESKLVRAGMGYLRQNDPKVAAFADDPVLGNLPEIWDLVKTIGKFMQEGNLASGGKMSGNDLPLEERLYKTMNSNN